MATGRLRRWLLVNYAGYPYAPNSLFPDNGLANLAGALLEEGAQVRIEDYATVSVLSALTPAWLSRRLRRVFEEIARDTENGKRPTLTRKARWLATLRIAELVRSQAQRRLLGKIGDELVQRVKDEQIEAVGFKLWSGDGMFGAAELARIIKKNRPNVRIFGGGPQVDIFMGRILERFPAFSALVFGEGEDTIRFLAHNGANEEAYPTIPNLLFRTAHRVERSGDRLVEDLNRLPLPVYESEIYPAMAGNEKIRILVLDESRGCVNNCAFCLHPVKSHHKLRTKAVPRLLMEVIRARERYGIHTFRLAGSSTPYSLLNEFAQELLRSGTNVLYSSFAHVRGSGSADFEAMRRSGCVALFFGIESGSQRVLDGMRKGIKVEDITAAVRSAHAAGICVVGSLIHPAPRADENTENETLTLLQTLPLAGVAVQPAGAIPSTDWFEYSERYGIAFPAGREQYLRRAFEWKIQLLLPPELWEGLPVTVNGVSFRAMLKQTADLGRQIERLGIPTGVSDDLFLICHRAGRDVRAFRDESRLAFFSGDSDRVGDLVRQINAAV